MRPDPSPAVAGHPGPPRPPAAHAGLCLGSNPSLAQLLCGDLGELSWVTSGSAGPSVLGRSEESCSGKGSSGKEGRACRVPGDDALGHPFPHPSSGGCLRPCPLAPARSFPLCPHQRVEGAGGGVFQAPSPTFPPLQDKSQLLLFLRMDFPAVIQFLPGVGGWLGVKTASGRPFSPPGQTDPSGEASCLCVAGTPSHILSVSVPGPRVVPTLICFISFQAPGSPAASVNPVPPLPSAIFRLSPRLGGPSPVIWSLAV